MLFEVTLELGPPVLVLETGGKRRFAPDQTERLASDAVRSRDEEAEDVPPSWESSRGAISGVWGSGNGVGLGWGQKGRGGGGVFGDLGLGKRVAAGGKGGKGRWVSHSEVFFWRAASFESGFTRAAKRKARQHGEGRLFEFGIHFHS